jgi:EAL domain-containing protein (putative c-di-GMP-specific phosphodiesterase class I)
MLSVPELDFVHIVASGARSHSLECKVEDTTISIETTDPEGFLSALSNDPRFSDFQLKSILVLVKNETSALNFDMFRDVRALYYYRNITSTNDVAECLQSRRLETHFQPLIDLRADDLYGYEALTRGLRQDFSLITPNELFGYAQTHDKVFYLDRLARETAIRTASLLRLEGNIFINFMPNAIYDPAQCLRTTFAIAKETHLDPSRLVFEVIETERIDDMGHLRSIFEHYRHNGFRVALDDVGSGYSGLNTMLDLRPDLIKIDREIVSGIDQDPMKQSLFRGLVDAARTRDITVIAEGIETEGELEFVREAGADIAQGYYFARPAKDPVRVI